MIALRRFVAFAAVTLLGACGCTQVGCDNRVSYRAPFDVERDVTYSVEMCFDGACMADDLRVEGPIGVTGDIDGSLALWENTDRVELAIGDGDFGGSHEVTVVIKAPSGDILAEFADTVELTRTQPNGAFCDPTCWSVDIGS